MKRSERETLTRACEDLRVWSRLAEQLRWAEAHLPLQNAGLLTEDDRFLVDQVEQVAASGDIDLALQAAHSSFLESRRKTQPARDAADRLVRLHEWANGVSAGHRLNATTTQLAAVGRAQREDLLSILDQLETSASRAWQMLNDDWHLVLSPLPMTSVALRTAAESLLEVIPQRAHLARTLATGTGCSDETCSAAHEAARVLVQVHREAAQHSLLEQVDTAAERLRTQRHQEHSTLTTLLDELDRRADAARTALKDSLHLPITRIDPLWPQERSTLERMVTLMDEHQGPTRLLLAGEACAQQKCAQLHPSGAALADFHREATQHSLLHQADAAAKRLRAQHHQEHSTLTTILDELHVQAEAARIALTNSLHLPITRSDPLTPHERSVLERTSALMDEHQVPAHQLLGGEACARDECDGPHRSGVAFAQFYDHACSEGSAGVVEEVVRRLQSQTVQERAAAVAVLSEVETWGTAASQALDLISHMPLTRSDAVPGRTQDHLVVAAEIGGRNIEAAVEVLDGAACVAGDCDPGHLALAELIEYHAGIIRSGVEDEILDAVARLLDQTRHEHTEVAGFLQAARSWPRRVVAIRAMREEAEQAVAVRTTQLVRQARTVELDGQTAKLFALKAADVDLVWHLTVLRDLVLDAPAETILAEAVMWASLVTEAAESGLTRALRCRTRNRCNTAHDVIPRGYRRAVEIEIALDRLEMNRSPQPTDPDSLLDPGLGLPQHLGTGLVDMQLLPGALLNELLTHSKLVLDTESAVEAAVRAARSAADTVRRNDVARTLRGMDLAVLKKASQEPIRVGPLEAYDLRSVWDVYKFQQEYLLESLAGLGGSSAQAITRAVIRIFEAVRDETPVRIDVRRKGKRTGALLEALRRWDQVRRFSATPSDISVTRAVRFMAGQGLPLDRVIALTVDRDQVGLQQSCEGLADRLRVDAAGPDIWTDFLTRPSDYFGMLSELGFLTEDEAKMHGDLPDEIIEAVRAKELKRDYLSASMRAYQSFGARFALVQEKVVIGDEMGLGKTVEALAVFAHLRANGQTHFLVVCPAAVVSNWIRETSKHTLLTAFRLHGPVWERGHAAKAWLRNGGVAVTTYDMLPWAQSLLPQVDLGCAVFDEAHYIKNPLAKRSLAAAELIEAVRYVVLMTGTPLENSVQEFRNLIGYLRPDLAQSAPEYLASKFRKHVAPAYLRRNQEDVLTELPELVEVDEWLGMSDDDERVYRSAVEDGQFMLMRRAAMLSDRSLKAERLAEIVAEAEANGRRVIVFSYFREVLEQVTAMLPGEVFGPLTGSVPAAARQGLVDRFSAAGHGAVLVAQIGAGGVGLNIQSASVVVICEPQLKPTTESQAVARAHRMGQTNTVQVHRLLTEDSVDERIRELLAEKRALFDDFARDSAIARQAPDSVDVSDAELARLVVQAERERLFEKP